MDIEYDELTEEERQRVDDLMAAFKMLRDSATQQVLAERDPPVIIRDVIAAG